VGDGSGVIIEYLNAALEAGDREAFLLALAHFLEAQDSIAGTARRASIYLHT